MMTPYIKLKFTDSYLMLMPMPLYSDGFPPHYVRKSKVISFVPPAPGPQLYDATSCRVPYKNSIFC